MASTSVSGSYQLWCGVESSDHATAGDRLDGLRRDLALSAHRSQRLDVGPVLRDLHQREVEREQHGVEVEAFETAQVHVRDAQAVAGDADEPHETLVACRGERLDGATGSERDLPLVGLDEVVELDHVDVGDVHALERSFQLSPRLRTRPFPRLGGEEDVRAMGRQPRSEQVLRRAVARRRVDVVQTALGDHRQRSIGTFLAHAPEPRGAEDHAGRSVAGAPEVGKRQHAATVRGIARGVETTTSAATSRRARPLGTASLGNGARRWAAGQPRRRRTRDIRWACPDSTSPRRLAHASSTV